MMKKNDEKALREKGFIPIEEYVQARVVSFYGQEEKGGSIQSLAESIRLYDEASQAFHCSGGDGYYIVQRCLQKYLDYKFMQQNNQFRFSNFAEEEEAQCEEGYRYISVKRKKEPVLTGTRADIYYLLNQADQTSPAARRCRDYIDSNRLQLTSVLIRIVEQAVESMEQNCSCRLREYGRLLRTVYMNQDTASLEVSELFGRLGVSKKQYYRIKSEAITLLSEMMFGIFAGEQGMAELYIKENKIVIPAIYR